MLNTRNLLFLVVAFVFAVASCATTKASGSDPDDMSRDEHMAAAEKEKAIAEQHEQQYDPHARAGGEDQPMSHGVDMGHGAEILHAHKVPGSTYNPTLRHKVEAEKHNDHARQHEAAAQALEEFEAEECEGVPKEDRQYCPLLGPIAKSEEIDGGVRLHLHEGVNVDAVLAHSRCHYAFGRTQGQENMPSCPLYLKNLRIEKSSDGKSIEITSSDPARVEEIRTRSATHVTD